ncbi:ATP-dependent zinc metalloprotease FtsH [Andreprevotia sp. IGB-42]|uniref:AAA family ATPase n=1 Tax=Andreprevotia sp. IGB-42 TaxID=2497473 RepID=UPI001357A21D|nr:AAA family ATPase [Andreprevotia sp. IGB-42]KAF0812420.1 ATP-dependent zinc metalloprotease FtsH [Andreprevotia sp. IGB-42]
MSAEAIKQLKLFWDCGYPVVLAETTQELATLKLVEQFANLERLNCHVWSAADGLRQGNGGASDYDTQPLDAALSHIDSTPRGGVYIFLDPHPYLDNAVTLRRLREVAQEHERTERMLVLIAPKLDLPPELTVLAAHFSAPVADGAAIRKIISDEALLYQRDHGSAPRADEAVYQLMVQYLAGTPADVARRLIRQALRNDGMLTRDDLAPILKQKQQIVGQNCLQFEFPDSRLDELGGFLNLKRWLSLRRNAFLQPLEGMEAPKGLLLLGVQGSGKSLAAKAVAGSWGLPLLRLDFGALYDKFHGETERNLRQALATAEHMAPCVLWIDEIEKGLAGDSGGESDGGVSRRVLGTLLTWMNERKASAFVVATANDVGVLPPELLRRGRFDEIFFVDLPDDAARAAIFRSHLARRKHDLASFDQAALLASSMGFSGAEIEAAVRTALIEAHAASRKLAQADLIVALQNTRPLSILRAEDLAALRAWASERTIPV